MFSKNGISPEWDYTTVLNDLNHSELLKMKQDPGKDILVGGPIPGRPIGSNELN
jgi:hypothetical protein